MPEITIITPFYNAAHFIQDYVTSLKSQTFSEWVCILVDDYSRDNGFFIASQLTKEDDRFHLYSNTYLKTRNCPASARNFALDRVTTPYIAFCDIDDIWHPSKLSEQLQHMKLVGADLCVTGYYRFTTSTLHRQYLRMLLPPTDNKFLAVSSRNKIPMLTVLSKSYVINNHHFRQIAHEDYCFWLEIFRSSPKLKFTCLPKYLAFYRVHTSNLSGRKSVLPLWTYSIYRLLGANILQSTLLTLRWMISHIKAFLSIKRTPRKLSVSELTKESPYTHAL